MLSNQQIITEADQLVANGYDTAQKVIWLGEINQEFFENVKVPVVYAFDYSKAVNTYSLPADARFRNMDKVLARSEYKSAMKEEVQAGRSVFLVDDKLSRLTLMPAPNHDGTGIARYFKAASSAYTTATVATDHPDADTEFHYVYVLGLAERIAKTNEDLARADQYATDYRNALNVAAQNYGGAARAN